MANVLAVAKQHAIIVLAQLGRSQRQIAAQLGIDRSTVKRYIDRELAEDALKRGKGAKPTIPITGSDGPKPTMPSTGATGRQSKCRPHEEAIKAALDRGLSAEWIWQDLKADHDFEGGYQSVRRFVRKLGSACPVVCLTLHVEIPGAGRNRRRRLLIRRTGRRRRTARSAAQRPGLARWRGCSGHLDGARPARR